jgi:hypothetical protein
VLTNKLLIRFVSLPTLIRMKEGADLPQDGRISNSYEQERTTMPSENLEDDGIDWSLTTWEGARREQLRRCSPMPLAEMILALEEMEVLAASLSRFSDKGVGNLSDT